MANNCNRAIIHLHAIIPRVNSHLIYFPYNQGVDILWHHLIILISPKVTFTLGIFQLASSDQVGSSYFHHIKNYSGNPVTILLSTFYLNNTLA